jgi:4'-phosphopantetheinyl transferase
MPHFNQEILHFGEVTVHLLSYQDYDPAVFLDQLTEMERERYFSFSHSKRKKEFVATRILRHRIFGFEHIHYDEHGAPYIDQEGYISISHANGIVGIALCKEFKVGLDLETVREKSSALSSKFITEEEASFLNTFDSIEMTKAWSAKEVLYKLAGRKELIFKQHLLLNNKVDEHWAATVALPNETLRVQLRIVEHGSTIISFNEKAIDRIQ